MERPMEGEREWGEGGRSEEEEVRGKRDVGEGRE